MFTFSSGMTDKQCVLHRTCVKMNCHQSTSFSVQCRTFGSGGYAYWAAGHVGVGS